jgi:hypothetical protein
LPPGTLMNADIVTTFFLGEDACDPWSVVGEGKARRARKHARH